jgi:hypothetical protein
MDELPDADPVVVLYIGGEGRSGSTVLSALLGNYNGFFPVGEIRTLWQALKTNELCGCGESISKCEFWRSVGERGFGGWDHLDVDGAFETDRKFVRHRHIPRLIVSSLRLPESARLKEYCQLLEHLYATVKDVSGCTVIVDSTKDPPYALLLRKVRGLDLRFIHLVRDSRGVAYSWSKKQIERPEYRQHPVLRGTFEVNWSTWRAALSWDVKNLVFKIVTLSARHRVVLYEALVSEPEQELACIVRFSDEVRIVLSEAIRPFPEFEFLPFHTLGGNRVRFERGKIRLHADDEWRTRMRRSQKVVVGVLTLPLLIVYGYVGIPVRFRRAA